MKTMIDDYKIFPGDHCGSVAMRGLLNHYCDLELPEAAVFGLGSGAASVYIKGPDLNPGAILFGRSMAMEQDVTRNLDIDYRERPEDDDGVAWEVVREEVLAGRPTMLSGDILYLDYREFKVNFPGHRFVLLGFDDETKKVSIADRIRSEPELCSYGALFTSRNPPKGLSTHNLWGRFHDTHVGRGLVDATERAIAICAKSMLGEAQEVQDPSENPRPIESEGMEVQTGIRAVRALADDVVGWSSREDAGWIAGYNASCIEKFGNGGGNFRRLYARFLSWARDLDPRLVPESAPALAVEAADGWTEVSNALFAASRDEANPQHWNDAADRARRVAEIEERLFRSLADATG
jgi:hypothetical protein